MWRRSSNVVQTSWLWCLDFTVETILTMQHSLRIEGCTYCPEFRQHWSNVFFKVGTSPSLQRCPYWLSDVTTLPQPFHNNMCLFVSLELTKADSTADLFGVKILPKFIVEISCKKNLYERLCNLSTIGTKQIRPRSL